MESINRQNDWKNATPYGRETIQGRSERALTLPREVLDQYKETASAFGAFTQTVLGNWDYILKESRLAQIIWSKFGPVQKALFRKSSEQILGGIPYTIRFDSTLGEDGNVAIFEPEIQNCGDGPLFQKINEYGRDSTIGNTDLLQKIQEYLKEKGPIAVSRSRDNMTFYWPTIKTLSQAIRTSGIETIPVTLDDLEISENGIFWIPDETSESKGELLTSPTWYKIKSDRLKIQTLYNQLGTKAIFFPNDQEVALFQTYRLNKVDIFPTPNPLIASKAILALMWDEQIRETLLNIDTKLNKEIQALRTYVPPSFIGKLNCPPPNQILPAVIKPIFGAKQQGIEIIGLPRQLEKVKQDTNMIIQRWVQPYIWRFKIDGEEKRFKTRLESFCWIENGQGIPVDFLATGSTSDIVGGNRYGPMTTVYFK